MPLISSGLKFWVSNSQNAGDIDPAGRTSILTLTRELVIVTRGLGKLNIFCSLDYDPMWDAYME